MLQIENMDVFYGKIQALHNLSLHVETNEAVAVLGANGAGKSTLINTIMGWLNPKSGSIRLQGKEITGRPPWERTKLGLGLSPERGRVFRDLSVHDNLRLGAYLLNDAAIKEQLEVVFELFPVLAERRAQTAKTLSGGEQQMLSIGRAMMGKPKVLLVDEASMGLAPLLVERVFDVIDQLRGRGVSILLVEQHAYGALEIVDRAYVLENGRIVLEGAPAILKQDERVRAAYLGG